MEIEYSNEVKGKVHAYRFTDIEKETIAASLKPVLKRIDAKIAKIENDPRNEGQATYSCMIDDLLREKRNYSEIIEHFSK